MIFSRSPAKRKVQIKTAVSTALVINAVLVAVFFIQRGNETPAPADFYGNPVILSNVSAAAARHFDVRTGCRISRFGVAPWRFNRETKDATWGDMTYRALTAAGMPEPAALMAVTAMRTGKPDETLGMGDTYGQGHTSAMYFLPRYDSTYRTGNRYTACLDSGTRFGNDRQESATVYRIGHEGKVYFVGEFLACGNVTRFYPAPPAWLPPVVTPVPGSLPLPYSDIPPLGAPHAPNPVYPSPAPQTWPGGPPVAPVVPFRPPLTRDVPEPGTLALVGAAVAAIIWIKRKK